MKKLLFISSSQHFVNVFLVNYINFLSKNNKVYLITNIETKTKNLKNIKYFHVPLNRKISFISDLISILRVVKLFFLIKPDTLISVTPKSIIFGIVIKFLSPRVKRIHIYTGIAWTNFQNMKKFFFILLDKINIKFSDKVIFDSKEQINFLKENGIISKKFNVIHYGSITGVNTDIFFKYNNLTKNNLKTLHNIPINSKVILYLGRMDIDKGILDLIKSYELLKNEFDVILLLVGKDEMNIQKYISKYPGKILYFPHTNDVVNIFNIADIFCLPSKREGFGNVLIESSACEVPIVGSNIFGLKSSLINNFNGLTFKVGNIADLSTKLKNLINNQTLCVKLGKNGREYVKKKFKPNDIINSLNNFILK